MQAKNSLSAIESLEIITSMIRQANGNYRNNSFYFLFWGWIVVVCDLGVYISLKFRLLDNPFLIWLLTIPAAGVSAWYGYRQQKEAIQVTLIDTINMWLWISYAILCFTIVGLGPKINFQINAAITLVSAIPTLLSGIIYRFKPLVWGGIIFWVCGILLFFMPVPEQFLGSAITIILSYLIPGYLLKNRKL